MSFLVTSGNSRPIEDCQIVGVCHRPQVLRAIAALLLLLAVSFLLPLVTNSAVAESDNRTQLQRKYDKAKQHYLQLARTDPGVENLMDWEKAAAELLTFLDQHKASRYAPGAMFALGRLYEYTYRRREFQTGLTRAVYFYERLAVEHPDDSLADDALLLLGDLKRDALRDPKGAEVEYRKVLAKYSKGDMVSKARSRLGLPEEPALNEPSFAPTAIASHSTVSEGDSNDAQQNLRPGVSAPQIGADGKEVFADSNSEKRPIIVIDPGHGGEEEGAHGVEGSLEKDVVLRISLLLEEYLRDRLRAKTILTRRSDIHVPLTDRTKLANDYKADIFISIHANASVYKNAKGIETYYLDNTNEQSSLKLAERENASLLSQQGGGDLGFILSDLIQNAKLEDSISLAHYLQKDLHSMLSRYFEGVKDLGVKKAPFYVLVGAHMPCVLVEVSFIDHPIEGRRLITPRYQSLIANALYEGIRAYFAKH